MMIAAGFVAPPKRIIVKKAPKAIKVKPITFNADGTEVIRRGRGRPRKYPLSTQLGPADLTTRLEQTQPLLASNLSSQSNRMNELAPRPIPTIDSLRGHRARSPSLSDAESSPATQRSRRDSPTTSASPSVESHTTDASSLHDVDSPFPPGAAIEDPVPPRSITNNKRPSSALLKVPAFNSKKKHDHPKEATTAKSNTTLKDPTPREKREAARKIKAEKRSLSAGKSTRKLRRSGGAAQDEVADSVVGRVRELYI